jgi:signal peptidase I
MKYKIIENIKTIFYALIIALIIRTFLFQPFYIPSSSMEPNLLIGDRIFVTKYSYGYSKHSLPFSPNIFNERIFKKKPKRGDVIVFKTPYDNRTDYIKRLIGIPGDEIQFINGEIYLNKKKINREINKSSLVINCGEDTYKVNSYKETLPENETYNAVYNSSNTMINSDLYVVPPKHYFFMGDNRDCSKDSRFLSSVGYVHFNNLVGKAQIIFFSNDKKKGSFFKFWKWHKTIRFERLLKKIK